MIKVQNPCQKMHKTTKTLSINNVKIFIKLYTLWKCVEKTQQVWKNSTLVIPHRII